MVNHLKNLQWYEQMCYPYTIGDVSEVCSVLHNWHIN